MGFDVECIVDAHTYPREYFCPSCQTLVFPSEALQTLCTHLYCKPCLTYVANGTRACPYDGLPVTETESIPLIESDKTLAESIGKVKVRCLYHKSGCSWEGPLSDSTSHCSGCSFGNALGVYPVQQATNGYQDNPSSGLVTNPAGAGQTAARSGFPASTSANSQTTTAPLLPAEIPYQQIAAPGVPYAGYVPYQEHEPFRSFVVTSEERSTSIYNDRLENLQKGMEKLRAEVKDIQAEVEQLKKVPDLPDYDFDSWTDDGHFTLPRLVYDEEDVGGGQENAWAIPRT